MIIRLIKSLLFSLFVLTISTAIGLAIAYTQRDLILLRLLRSEGPKHISELKIESLTTHLIGPLSLELSGLSIQTGPTAPRLNAERVSISSSLNIFELRDAIASHGTLPLKIQLISARLESFPASPATEDGETADPIALVDSLADSLTRVMGRSVQGRSPGKLDIEFEFRDVSVVKSAASTVSGATGSLRLALDFNHRTPIATSGRVTASVGIGPSRLLPFKAEWDGAVDSESILTLRSFKLTSLGLDLSGQSRFNFHSHEISGTISGAASDLSAIQLDSKEYAALGVQGRLAGAFSSQIKISGVLGKTVHVSGTLNLKDGLLPLEMEHPSSKTKINGPVSIAFTLPFDLDYDFSKSKLQRIDMSLGHLHVDALDTEVRVPNKFVKLKRVPLSLTVDWSATDRALSLKLLRFALANLTVDITGQSSLELEAPSDLHFSVQLPSLSGWPALVPAIVSMGASGLAEQVNLANANGSLSAVGSLSGPLKTPSLLDLAIETFDIKGLQLPLNLRFKEGTRLISGVLLGSLSLKGTKRGDAIAIQRSTGDINLSELKLDIPGLISKLPRHPLKITWQAQTLGALDSIKVDRLQIHTDQSSVGIEGTFKHQATGWNGNAVIKSKLKLTDLVSLLPIFQSAEKTVGNAEVIGDIKIAGLFLHASPQSDSKGIAASPIAINGSIRVEAPVLRIKKTAATQPENQAGPKSPPKTLPTNAGNSTSEEASPQAVLPDFFRYALFKKADLRIDSKFKTASLNGIATGPITSSIRLKNGVISGAGHVAGFFDGDMEVKTFTVQGLALGTAAGVTASGTAEPKHLSLKKMIEWAKPEYAGDFSGVMNTAIVFSVKPLSPTLVSTLELRGAMKAKNARFSSRPFEQLARERLIDKVKGLPGFASWGQFASQPKKAQSSLLDGLAEIDSQFAFKAGILQLTSFHSQTAEQDELSLQGKIDMGFHAALKGEVKLKSVAIGGSFREANSDSSGRLVIPISFNGLLSSPTVDLAADALSEMAKKTADFELKKLKRTVEESAKKKVIDTLKDELKRGLGL